MKKLIVRADDFGYTVAHNDGTMEAIDNGIVTSVDLMLDTPGTLDAMERIRAYPWISIGWHAHFWGRPVLDPSEVPSMVDAQGKFKFRHDSSLKNTCRYDEVVRECRAQLERMIAILGRVPDTTSIAPGPLGVFEQARKQVCDEYGIVYGFASKPNRQGILEEALPRYQPLNIYMPNQPATVYKACYLDSFEARKAYDPVRYYLEDQDHLAGKQTVITAWHPGYLDPYVMAESSLQQPRVIDVAALTSDKLKQWIIDQKIELINHRDALYGTHEYQNHLRHIGSPLWLR